MWERIKRVSAKTWTWIVAAAALVIAIIGKLVWDRQDKKSEDAVTEAEAVKANAEFHDAHEAAVVVAEAVAKEDAVKADVAEAVAAGPNGSEAQVVAITDEFAEMSRKRHEEALRRAGKRP